MAKPIILCADSTCDLSAELIEKYQVKILPMHVNLEENSYLDGVDINPDAIYDYYHEHKVLPKTAALNMDEVLEFVTPYIEAGNDVLCVTLGSGLSTTYNSFRLAAMETEGLYVVDSNSLSTGFGLTVMAAGDRIAAGMPVAQIAEEVQALTQKVEASFIVDNLEFLHKGGRCSAVAMLGANVLKLKPCIEVSNEGGKMGVSKKYRGTLERVLEDYVKDRLEGRDDIRQDRIFITHAGIAQERIDLVRAAIGKYMQFDEIYVTRAGCTISSHCGPNTLGILFVRK
ncbi:MAG: DegV family protein [Ruminococcaceae bacterium]|nr:DegV family protein [Oscillospiraceae bacterium]